MLYKLIPLIVFLLPLTAPAQEVWEVFQARGGDGLEVLDLVRPMNADAIALGGRFSSSFVWSGIPFTSRGGEDVYFGRADSRGEWDWSWQIGSSQDDELLALLPLPDDELAALGSYRGVLELADTNLVSPQGNKSLFLCTAVPVGIPWALSMDGRGLKGGGDLRWQDETLWMCGFFGDTLRIRETRLDASGDTDALLLGFSGSGELKQALTFGGSGDTRARRLLPLPGGDLILGGVFNDTLRLADTTLAAGTFDNDIFLLRIGPGGSMRWAKRLGGVLDDELTGLERTPTGAIVLSGYFSGLLNFEDGIALQSTNAQPDGFVALLDQEGQTIEAASYGGAGNVRALALHQRNDLLAIGGTFNGTLQAGDLQISSTGQQSGFAMALDEDLSILRLTGLRSDEGVFLSAIASTAQGDLLAGGSFSGRLQHDAMPQANQLDLFLAGISITVSTKETAPESDGTLQFIRLDRNTLQATALPDNCTHFQLLDLQGRSLLAGPIPPDRTWRLQGWPAGIYLMHLRCLKGARVYRFQIY